MFSNQAKYNQKISKVINLSSNYKKHYNNLAQMKPAVDFSDHKHMKKVAKLSVEKDRYSNNLRKLRQTELQRQNQNIIKRIRNTNSSVRKSFNSPSPHPQFRTLEHSSSKKSIMSNISEKTCGSNFQRRTMRQKQIERENKKIASRIMHPKIAKQMNFSKVAKFYEQQQSYSRIRSRFSDRSQGIMQSLALGNLKLQKKNVQFLPQLSFKHLDPSLKTVNKTLTARSVRSRQPSKNKTIVINPQRK